jgi:hypothetical protein
MPILPKSGNEWGKKELRYFKINLIKMTVKDFFQGSPSLAVPPSLHDYAGTDLRYRETVEDGTLHARLRELSDADNLRYHETAVDIFALRLLEMIQFTRQPVTMKMNLPLRLKMSGEHCSGNPDLAAVDDIDLVSGYYQEEKRRDVHNDVAGQLIAEGIAAFQHNSFILATRNRPADRMRFPAITMVGPSPTFYIVNITAPLAQTVEAGNEPSHVTCVYYCKPDPKGLGMAPVDNRRWLISHLIAFKDLMGKMV